MWTPQEKAQCEAWFIETKSDTQVQRLRLKQMEYPPPVYGETTCFHKLRITNPNSRWGRRFPSVLCQKVSLHLGTGLCLYERSFLLWNPHFSSNLRHLENRKTL
ncbi:hypothetical protein AVEN_16816-1 [Araneus ventricosus]|uniref:DUF4817 domain-containing protein n=1 Tax=Araneus ventricosus TaxID=182803 RepID=A0A4Y2BRL0_ARAVE|nr:hypothetical protein AVEN_16816-1 [Araneus ventricosus]